MTLLNITNRSIILLTVLILFVFTVIHHSSAEENPSTLSGRVISGDGEPVAETPIVLFHVKIRESGGLDTLYDTTLYPFLRQDPPMRRHHRMGKMPDEQESRERPPFLKTVTDSEGRFTFTEIASGLAQIMVLHSKPPKKKPAPPGREHLNYTPPPEIQSIKFGKVAFYPHEFSFSPETGGVTFAIKPGSKIGNVEVIMRAGLKNEPFGLRNELLIDGKIIFQDGSPLSNASLKVDIGVLVIGDTGGGTSIGSIHTSPAGDFRLSVYVPGIYTLSIDHRGLSAISELFILKEKEHHEGLVMTLDGNSDELADPSPEDIETEPDRWRNDPDIPKVWVVNPKNGHAYMAFMCDSREEAQTKADAEGAHLVTITSEEEQVWLEVAFGHEPYWLGLTYVAFGSQWLWDTGEPLTYTNWTLDALSDPFASPRIRGGEERNFAIMSDEGHWKSVESDGGFGERVRMAIMEKDGLRAKKLDNIE